MYSAKEITVTAMYSALMIGVQLALSPVLGIELVTFMLAVFSVAFGVKRGITVAVTFSVLRCLIFGFFPAVVVLYLIYYPLFATVFGLMKKVKRGAYPLFCLTAAALTACFTLLDDLITPLMLGITSSGAWKAYFLASLPVMLTQTASAAISSAVLYYPVKRVLDKSAISLFGSSPAF